VYAYTLDCRAVAQRRLITKPHLQLHPDLRPALICDIGGDEKRSRSTPRRYPKLPIVFRPPPPKSPAAAPEKPD
jgi:hypothetical protein